MTKQSVAFWLWGARRDDLAVEDLYLVEQHHPSEDARKEAARRSAARLPITRSVQVKYGRDRLLTYAESRAAQRAAMARRKERHGR